jgi:hypothetical protein
MGIEGLLLQFLSFDQLFLQWEAAGVFDVLLPFLLMFSIIFGILGGTRILGGHRGVASIISIVLSLLIIRVPYTRDFILTISGGLGVGLMIVLLVILLAGLFINNKNMKSIYNTLAWGGVVVAVIVVIGTLNQFAWFGSYWWQANWKTVLWVILIAGAFIAVIMSPSSTQRHESRMREASNPLVLPLGPLRGDGWGS